MHQIRIPLQSSLVLWVETAKLKALAAVNVPTADSKNVLTLE